jgi:hypothetical protein
MNNAKIIAELVAALKVIAAAADFPDRDRFGRPKLRASLAAEDLRRLMLKYGVPNGGRDTYDQIVFLARGIVAWAEKEAPGYLIEEKPC